MMKLQDAVKKETTLMATGCAVCCVVTVLVFAILHIFYPDKVPFDYRVFLGAVLGSAVAVGNFFWMAVTVQKVSSCEDDDKAKSIWRTSLRYRTLAQLAWGILAILLPVINTVAGIVPLFFPSIVIKVRGIFPQKEGSKTDI
ncbi:MAG: ATP synthase subunit I [Lachnospiraceae bacterium]|nr:ATP synthase subunit I [Lachnospiraceae bacterium]